MIKNAYVIGKQNQEYKLKDQIKKLFWKATEKNEEKNYRKTKNYLGQKWECHCLGTKSLRREKENQDERFEEIREKNVSGFLKNERPQNGKGLQRNNQEE